MMPGHVFTVPLLRARGTAVHIPRFPLVCLVDGEDRDPFPNARQDANINKYYVCGHSFTCLGDVGQREYLSARFYNMEIIGSETDDLVKEQVTP